MLEMKIYTQNTGVKPLTTRNGECLTRDYSHAFQPNIASDPGWMRSPTIVDLYNSGVREMREYTMGRFSLLALRRRGDDDPRINEAEVQWAVNKSSLDVIEMIHGNATPRWPKSWKYEFSEYGSTDSRFCDTKRLTSKIIGQRRESGHEHEPARLQTGEVVISMYADSNITQIDMVLGTGDNKASDLAMKTMQATIEPVNIPCATYLRDREFKR